MAPVQDLSKRLIEFPLWILLILLLRPLSHSL